MGADGDLVVLGTDAGGGHEQVQLLYLYGHFAKAVAFAADVVEGFLVPVFAD